MLGRCRAPARSVPTCLHLLPLGKPDHWGGKPAWERVTNRYVADGSARVAALERGEADLIDTVPPQEGGVPRGADPTMWWHQRRKSARRLWS
jgi:ABC-type transport system substrate-binding protein